MLYEQFDFDDFSDEELFGKEDNDIKVGDNVFLIDRTKALYDLYNERFINSGNPINWDFIVSEIRSIKGELCIRSISTNWYKMSCFSKTKCIKEQFNLDDFSDEELFGKNDEIEVGDIVFLKNKENALYDYDKFVDSGYNINWAIKVKKIKILKGELCICGGGLNWYKASCFSKYLKEQFNFDDFSDEELFGNDKSEFKIGDKVRIIKNDWSTGNWFIRDYLYDILRIGYIKKYGDGSVYHALYKRDDDGDYTFIINLPDNAIEKV